MGEALKSSEQRCSRLAGRKSSPNGPRDPRPSFPSGSVSAPAKRPEIPRLQKARRTLPVKLKQRKNTRRRRKKRKRKKRRNKSWVFSSYFEANIRPQSPDVT